MNNKALAHDLQNNPYAGSCEGSLYMKHYDLFVIGSGSGAARAAFICRRAGFRVGIAEKAAIGGIGAAAFSSPQKRFTAASDAVNLFQSMIGCGLKGSVSVDWEHLKGVGAESVSSNLEEDLRGAGIEIFHGKCSFADKNILNINGEQVFSRFILIATGAAPAKLSFAGSEYLTPSREFMNLESLPSSIVFVGGGYISFELAHIAARAGAKAVIVEALPRVLRGFDDDLARLLVRESAALGIDVITGAPVRFLEKYSNGLRMQAGTHKFVVSLAVHGAGRVPDIDELCLEAGEISTNEQGIAVNCYLQSVSNPAVYVAGDVNALGMQLKPVAEMESAAAAANMLLGNHEMPEYNVVARALLTAPQLCAVGMGEREAAIENIPFDVHFFNNFSTQGGGSCMERSQFAFKIISEKGTGRILGVHILGQDAAETINAAALAIKGGCTIKNLKNTALVFPSQLYDIMNIVNY